MLSNDNNIETIAQLVEELKKYISLKSEYIRLNVVEKAVRLFTVITMAFVLTVIFLLALIFFSFAIAYGLGSLIGNAWAFCIVGGLYLLLFFICIIRRRSWIERPLVRFLASMFME